MKAAAMLLLTLLAAPASPAVLRGRVVTIDGKPAPEAQLQLVGHAALLAIRRPSGEFEQPLAGDPPQVEVAAVAGPLEVLYPPNGLLAVPRDDAVRVTVVVGRPEKMEISDMLAERLLRLETTLRDQGIRWDAGRDSLSDDVRRVLARLDVAEGDFRARVAFKREQAATVPEVLATIDAYIREAKDLRDLLGQFGPAAAKDRNAVDGLQTALGEYNAAFTTLNDNRNAYESKILSYWTGERGERLLGQLADVYFEAVENIHQALVLPLNPNVIALQRRKPSRRDRDDATAAFVHAAAQLDPRIAALERRASELREALQREVNP